MGENILRRKLVVKRATDLDEEKTSPVLKDWVAYGLRCRVLEGPFGNYNGYVAVPKTHPAWGKDYIDMWQDIDVHGGLTFGRRGEEGDERWPDPDLWWFGFDTAHGFDYLDFIFVDGKPRLQGYYWRVEDVAGETERMAEQLAEMAR